MAQESENTMLFYQPCIHDLVLKQPPRQAESVRSKDVQRSSSLSTDVFKTMFITGRMGQNNSWNSSSLGVLSVRTSLSVGRRKQSGKRFSVLTFMGCVAGLRCKNDVC